MRLVTQTDLIANRIGDEECVRMLARAGFDAIDWSFFEMTEGKGVWCTDGWREHALALRAAADEAGVGFSQAHAPFPSSNGTLPFDEVIVQRIVRSMEVASVLGVKNIVVHPKQHLYYPKNQQQLFDENVAFYKELMPHAQRLNITVCTENMWQRDVNRNYIIGSVCAAPEEFCALIDAVGDPHLAACLDVGHSALTGWDIPDTIRALGKRLHALHIHDVNYVRDCHTLPYQESLPWEDIMAALGQAGYAGDFTFEANNFLRNLPVELLEPACAFMARTGRYLMSRIEAHRA